MKQSRFARSESGRYGFLAIGPWILSINLWRLYYFAACLILALANRFLLSSQLDWLVVLLAGPYLLHEAIRRIVYDYAHKDDRF